MSKLVIRFDRSFQRADGRTGRGESGRGPAARPQILLSVVIRSMYPADS